MKSLITILMLSAVTAMAEQRYTWTNELGEAQTSTSLADAQNYAYSVTSDPKPEPVYAPRPAQFIDGIETPVLVLQDVDTQQAWGFVADGGDLVGGYLDHASPRPDPDTLRQRIEAERQAKRDLRQSARTIRTNMVANIAQAQSITVSSSSTAAQVRSATIELRRELIDTQQELRDLTRVVQKLMKDSQ